MLLIIPAYEWFCFYGETAIFEMIKLTPLFSLQNLMAFNGIRLEELRQSAELTRQQLAKKLKIDATIIWRYENGKIKNPPFERIEKLAKFFKVNIETFRK